MPTLCNRLSINSIVASGAAFEVPSGVTATPSGTANNRTITADWTAPSTAPQSYQVEYSYNGGAFTGTQAVAHPTVTYDFTGLEDGFYRVRVRAIYADGNSSWVVSAESSTGLWLIPVMQPLGVV